MLWESATWTWPRAVTGVRRPGLEQQLATGFWTSVGCDAAAGSPLDVATGGDWDAAAAGDSESYSRRRLFAVAGSHWLALADGDSDAAIGDSAATGCAADNGLDVIGDKWMRRLAVTRTRGAVATAAASDDTDAFAGGES